MRVCDESVAIKDDSYMAVSLTSRQDIATKIWSIVTAIAFILTPAGNCPIAARCRDAPSD
jgi:hypothetical protein